MATAKAKTAVKKSAKAPAKKAAPIMKAKAPAKVKVSAKMKAKAPPPANLAQVKSVAPKNSVTPQKAVPPKNESVFARLLREKAERHEQFLKQNENQHHSHDQRMPHNHASYSKFAGPRRRAS
jgi:hypothetical protein